MPGPDSERIDALSELTVRLLQRLDQMEARLASLEGPRRNVPSAEPPPLPAAMARPMPLSPVQPPPMQPPPVAPPPLPRFDAPAGPPAAVHKQQFETRMGLTWLNRIGVLTLVIGVAFFFKYAIDNQWIGETGRVAIGVMAGLAILAGGDVLWRRGQKVFAQGVCGLGASILYLSFYASFGLYHLLPQAAAFVLMVSVTAMTGALALRYDGMAIAALGLFGGYATPLLLSTGQDAPWTFFSYVFLVNVGAVAIARFKHWRPIGLMAFVATAILYGSWFATWFRPEKRVVATAAALAFYGLFAFVEWEWIFYAVQVLAGLGLALIWKDATPYLLLSLLVGFVGLAIADGARKPVAAVASFGAFWGAYGLWNSSNGKPEELGIIFGLLTCAFVMYLVWTPFEKLVRAAEVRTQDLTVMALNGLFYFGFSYDLLNPDYHAWLGLLAAAVAGVHLLLGVMLWKERSRAGGDTRPVLLALGIALGFLTLAVPIQFSGYSITLSWALEAAALIWIGKRTNETRLQWGAALIYTLVFFRLYEFDAMLAGVHRLVVNPRLLAFAVSAVSFWLGAWWTKSMRIPAAAGYVAGHLILLSACMFELDDWVRTEVAVGNRGSVLAIGVSILMAVYAVVLISLGVAGRFALNRMLGLGLIGFVVVKLYLYDVWEASRLFRMAAFVSLGILLLLTSYLYSRFRPSIENWWRDEQS